MSVKNNSMFLQIFLETFRKTLLLLNILRNRFFGTYKYKKLIKLNGSGKMYFGMEISVLFYN